MEKEITKTTNFNYKIDELKFNVSLTTTLEKKTVILLAENALKDLKQSNFLVDFNYKSEGVWLKFTANDAEQKFAMTSILTELINDILKDLK